MADRVDARVRATCARCGTVDIPIADARLVAGADANGASTLGCDCPRCGAALTIAVDARTAGLLLRADVPLHAPDDALGRSSAPGDRRG